MKLSKQAAAGKNLLALGLGKVTVVGYAKLGVFTFRMGCAEQHLDVVLESGDQLLEERAFVFEEYHQRA